MARFLPVALFLLSLSSISAGEQRWIKATSPNFELYTTAGEKKSREAIQRFEQVRNFFVTATAAKPATKGRVRIVAFQSDKEYKPYQVTADSAGHAGGNREYDEIVMRSISSEDFPVAVHEYVHVLMKPFEHIPLWLNEGAAELYSTLHGVGRKVQVGDLIPGRLYSLQRLKWIDLDTLCAVDHDSPYYAEGEKREIFYAESWALMHMLVLTKEYRPKLPVFLEELAKGTPQTEAFQHAFGKPTWEIWTDLQDYMRGRRFNVMLFDTRLSKSEEEPEVVPVTPLESGLVLARVLSGTPKTKEALEAYLALARDYPSEPTIPEELAYQSLQTNQTEAARGFFAKAVKLGSRKARLYYDYAGLIDDDGAEPGRRIELLQKAVELDPDFRDARMRLAFLMMAAEDYKGALSHFAQFKNVAQKEAFDFFYAIAYATYRVGDKSEARRAADRAAQYASTDGERNTITELQAALSERPREEQMAPMSDEDAAPSVAAAPAEPRTARGLKIRTVSVNGTVEHLECMNAVARLRVRVDGKPVSFLMTDPQQISVRGTSTMTYEFVCGPQKQIPVTVEYEPAKDAKLGTVGIVRAIEFK